MGLDAFTNYWRTTHAEAVKKVPGIRKYVQSQTIESGYRKGEPIYDGIAELWYEDTAAMHRGAATPDARAALADDENFIDIRSFATILTEEIVQKDGPANPSMVKLVEFVYRQPQMDVQSFQKYWREIHDRLPQKSPRCAVTCRATSGFRAIATDARRYAMAPRRYGSRARTRCVTRQKQRSTRRRAPMNPIS